ncbi:hypothetical protein BDP81DRAFT_422516 [Colletotrichum phormii]|uniref:Uncharacterized protein n=1 Tax=Colletotrichum phormii TaxID=359342 RepID=A0AAI9ZXD6_9PEZI|nr:uncharacterized protein BDP81DRAFT_422516 [Colletotrichum phormii]KAK1638703.1 hypothetical protein BDP81DRAFT_422516 [Colletotrichum phormii]
MGWKILHLPAFGPSRILFQALFRWLTTRFGLLMTSLVNQTMPAPGISIMPSRTYGSYAVYSDIWMPRLSE